MAFVPDLRDINSVCWSVCGQYVYASSSRSSAILVHDVVFSKQSILKRAVWRGSSFLQIDSSGGYLFQILQDSGLVIYNIASRYQSLSVTTVAEISSIFQVPGCKGLIMFTFKGSSVINQMQVQKSPDGNVSIVTAPFLEIPAFEHMYGSTTGLNIENAAMNSSGTKLVVQFEGESVLGLFRVIRDPLPRFLAL